MQQRAKILSHLVQRMLRQKRITDKLQEERALVEKEMEARLAIYKIVDEADEIL